MAKRTFFSFHYKNDVWRASQVRNSDIVKREIPAYTRTGTGTFIDASLWEEAKKKGEAAIRRMIDEALKNTSVTCVLIGKETASRPWVQYEIRQSREKGNGLVGVYIHGLKDQKGEVTTKGPDPFVELRIQNVPTYDWEADNGFLNLAKWIDSAPSKN